MFRKAAEMGALDMGRSWVIGDKTSDLEAARAAGLSGGVLVLTGHGAKHQAGALGLETPAFRVAIENSTAGTLWLLDDWRQAGNGERRRRMNGPDGSVTAQADVPDVLLLARELDLGGSERQLAVTALGLDRALFQPHVACFRAGGFRARELKRAGVPVLELGVRSLVSRSALDGARRLGRYLRRHRIQVVHAFDVPSVLFAVPVARWYRVPVVLSSQRAHRALTPGLTRHLLRLTDRLADGIVVNSQAVARELVAEDGVPRSLLHLAYNGIDTDRFRPAGPREQSEEHPRGQPEGNSGALGDRLLPGPMPSGAGEQPEGNSGILGDRRPPGPVPSGTEGHSRAALPWSEPRLVIGVACALRPEKGLFTLLDAFARMRERYPQARLLIVGSGPMGDATRRESRTSGDRLRCHFQPAVEDVAPWLRPMDISACCRRFPKRCRMR